MKNVLERLTANGLQDLEGLKISGSLPISEALLNEIATDALKAAQTNSPMPPKPENPIDVNALLRNLRVQQFQIKLHEGKMLIEFNVQR